MPTTPFSSRCPAIRAATVVPCPTGSTGRRSSRRPGRGRAAPGRRGRGGTASTPESRTATTTPRAGGVLPRGDGVECAQLPLVVADPVGLGGRGATRPAPSAVSAARHVATNADRSRSMRSRTVRSFWPPGATSARSLSRTDDPRSSSIRTSRTGRLVYAALSENRRADRRRSSGRIAESRRCRQIVMAERPGTRAEPAEPRRGA